MGERFDMSRPIYAQIVERLKAKILAGVYPPGGHLDSVRDMAAAAGVNPNTMQRALAQLEAEGLVYTERTTGRFVSPSTSSSGYCSFAILVASTTFVTRSCFALPFVE